MFYLKSGNDFYWDGIGFQMNHHKAIVCGGYTGFRKDLRRARKLDPECQITALSPEHWEEFAALRNASEEV